MLKTSTKHTYFTLHDSISRVIEKVEESSGLNTVTVSHIAR